MITGADRRALGLVTNAALPDRDGLHDLVLAGGRVVDVRPAGSGPAHPGDGERSPRPAPSAPTPRAAELDAGGRLVLPGLVDAHVHLDKAFQLDQLQLDHQAGTAGGVDGGITAALAATARLRAAGSVADLVPGMDRAARALVGDGTVAARVHVEVDPSLDPALVDLHVELPARTGLDLHLQLVAFAQNGTTSDDAGVHMQARLERALADGCSVLGGCPYADADPAAHLELMGALARDHAVGLDLHLDLTDDPDAAQVDLVLAAVDRFGLHGRVVVGHLTALSSMPPARAATVIHDLAAAGIAVVAIPTTDLWLSGRSDAQAPRRGLTRIRQLLAAGVPVALASNNHQNAFTPVSGGGLLRIAWLAGLVAHLGSPAEQLALLAAVTSVPAGLIGLDPLGPVVGQVASFAVVDCARPLDAVREAPPVHATIINGIRQEVA